MGIFYKPITILCKSKTHAHKVTQQWIENIKSGFCTLY